MVSEAEMIELVLRWEEARENGTPLSLEELCADTPERVPILQEYLQQLRRFEEVDEWEQTAPFPASQPEVMPEIPGYELLDKLGRGGMGVVFKARYLPLNQDRAVKVIREAWHMNQGLLQRFERKAKLLARLQHDHIVTVHEARLHEGQPYFVMPLIRGGCLGEKLEVYTGKPRQAAALMEKVARAVHFAHENGVVHRDLKPANILLNEDDKPLVSDFGIAMLLQANWEETDSAARDLNIKEELLATRITHDGAAIGTLPYMAPEQVNGDLKAIDRTTDVWALGVILYLLLTGERPFPAKESSTLVQQITSAAFVPPHKTASRIDRSLSNIAVKCLQADPAQRYQTADELANDLNAWLHGRRYSLETRRRRFARLARRWAVPAIAGIAILAAVVLIATRGPQKPADTQETKIDPYQSYDEHVRKVQAKLKRGKAETLIGPGVAKPHYWMRTKAGVKITSPPMANGKPDLVIDSRGASFLELLPSVPLDHYRVRALMRHEKASETRPHVGIGCCYSEYPIAAGFLRLLPVLAFAEFGGEARLYRDAKGRSALVHIWSIYDDEKRLSVDGSFAVTRPAPNTPVPKFLGTPTPFRELSVEVGPKGIKAFWRDDATSKARLCANVTARRLQQQLGMVRIQLRKVPGANVKTFQFPVNGGVGVFANDSAVTVRQFIIEPLPPEPE